jgi:hypothetical protein
MPGNLIESPRGIRRRPFVLRLQTPKGKTGFSCVRTLQPIQSPRSPSPSSSSKPTALASRRRPCPEARAVSSSLLFLKYVVSGRGERHDEGAGHAHRNGPPERMGGGRMMNGHRARMGDGQMDRNSPLEEPPKIEVALCVQYHMRHQRQTHARLSP